MISARDTALAIIDQHPRTAMLVALDIVRIVADERLRRRDPTPPVRQTEPQKIIAGICSYYGVGEKDLMSRHRYRHFVQARQMAWWLMHEHLKLSYGSIATIWGFHHTNVMDGVRRAKRFQSEFAELSRQLGFVEAVAEAAE